MLYDEYAEYDEYDEYDEYLDNICIICYDKSDNILLCYKCKYLYCMYCSKKINYNCSICFRINRTIINNSNFINNTYNNIENFYMIENELSYYDLIENERYDAYIVIYFYSKLLSYTLIKLFIFLLLDIKYFIIIYIIVILYYEFII